MQSHWLLLKMTHEWLPRQSPQRVTACVAQLCTMQVLPCSHLCNDVRHALGPVHVARHRGCQRERRVEMAALYLHARHLSPSDGGDMGSPLQVVCMPRDSAAWLQICQVSKQAGTLNSPTHSWWRRLYTAHRVGQLMIQHTAMTACILSRPSGQQAHVGTRVPMH